MLGVYGAESDGNAFEVMWILPREAWGDDEHAVVIERLDLDREIASWSGVHTAWELPEGAEPTGQAAERHDALRGSTSLRAASRGGD
jgi:hypothetical protein